MKKILQFIILLGFAFSLCGCPCYEDPSIDIYIKNNSNDTIAAISRLHHNAYIGLRDTILDPYNMRRIVSSDSIREWALCGEIDFGISLAKRSVFMLHYDFDTISIFVLSYSTYKNKPWAQIAEDYNILARYDITNENIRSRIKGDKGEIILPYPPNEDISDIHTYVP